MRSRSWLEHAGVALGAAADSIWSGGLAAALTRAPMAVLTVFAGVTMVAAAFLARRFGRGDVGERVASLLAVTLILIGTGVLLAAGRSWAHPYLPWQVVRDVVYVGGLVLLGIYLGRAAQSPEAAVKRAVRAFALLCAVLVLAALAGSLPGWASAAVVASFVIGALLIVTVRCRDLTELVDSAERLPAWPWLLAVVGAVLVVIAIGVLLSQILRVDVLLWALDSLAGVLRYALAGVAYLIGYAGAGLLRGIAWLLGVFHVHALHPVERPRAAPTPAVLRSLSAPRPRVWRVSSLIVTAVGALAAIALSFALVAVALRRLRREPPTEAMVAEEREALASLRSAAGVSAAQLGRRLRRRLRMRRLGPRTPAELVRRRYAELERRLSRAGRPRSPGVTVRDHLAAVAAAGACDEPAAVAAALSPRAELEAPVSSAAAPRLPPPAADLAAIYEMARYSAHAVDATQARRFEALARAFSV
jgi:hypothetical protein